ncbi:MAG TPA: CDP-diacylglycerol--serine O-phosphatidyltransferase [Prolixibacteraceae bacterium]|nr:CDP-diacylglycerol--serine O-phosphatidyltransferase [Prolixibacteraceae bacterium]
MIKKHIPNFITSLNVLCGSIAVVFIMKGVLTTAVLLIMLAALFDFLDGLSARMLKAYSPMGKELDSLADMISFGLAPGLIMYKLLETSHFNENVGPDLQSFLSPGELLIVGSAFLIPVFSALRLAKFNIDERQTSSFIGLPTPANALFISSLALIREHCSYPAIDTLLLSTPVLIGITILFSWLLVAEIPMFSMKFKSLGWQNNKVQYIFLCCAVLLMANLQLYGIAATVLLFIAISVFLSLAKK